MSDLQDPVVAGAAVPSPDDHDDGQSSYDSSGSRSSVYYSSDDDLSEDDAWQRDIRANGQVFHVRDVDVGVRTATDELAGPSPAPPAKGISIKLGTSTGQSRVRGAESVAAAAVVGPSRRRHVEVVLNRIDSTRRPNRGRRCTQLELLLGIIPERTTNGSLPDLVSVLAVVPNSEASRNRDVRIGDVIHKIQETEVTWSNLDDVLSSLEPSQSKQVKLTLATETSERSSSSSSVDETVVNRKSSELSFPKLVTGRDDGVVDVRTVVKGHELRPVPHGIVYLTLGKSDSSDLNEDILYQYPAVSNKLVPIRGAFFTINSLTVDVFGQPPNSSSVSIDSKLVHVCYAREDKEVLLVAMPADCVTVYRLTELTRQIVRSLKFQYKTLHKCFTDKSDVANLNHFFARFFLTNMPQFGPAVADEMSSPFRDRPFLKCLGSPQFLRIPTSLRYCLSDIMSDLESSDFADISEDRYWMRRLFSITGTLLFYRGYLVCSHLPEDDIACIDLYLEGNGLLERSRDTKLSRVVVWREVHPNRTSKTDSRWFLLIVGRNHTLLCVILEAGGCASRAVGPQAPDPFYVERCRSMLCQLEVQHGPWFLDSWVDQPLNPELVSAESMALFQSGKTAKATNGVPDKLSEQRATSKGLSASKLSLGSLSGWHQSAPDVTANSSKKEVTGETDSDTTSLSLTPSGTSDDTTPILGRRDGRREDVDRRRSSSDANSQEEEEDDTAACSAKNGRSNRYLPSFLDLTSLGGDNLPSTAAKDRNLSPPKLTSGPHNVLFHYAYRDSPDGVLHCPTRNFAIGEELNEDVLHNFKSACLVIQKALGEQINMQKKAGNLETKSPDPFIEQGILFNVPSSSSVAGKRGVTGPLTYWVIGRLFWRLNKEFYVCYHDSCPQMTCEMAYLIAFGNCD